MVQLARRRVIDTSTLGAEQGFVILGDNDADGAGCSVSFAGDVNGDGLDDVIVGASGNDDGGEYAGAAYVVFGSTSGFGTDAANGAEVVDLATLAPSEGFVVVGNSPDDLLVGGSVSHAGDVNGDGFDDLIVGAAASIRGGAYAGAAYVIFGASNVGDRQGRRQVLDLAEFSTDDGFVIVGAAAGDYSGYGVSSAGDVNGDGFDDVIIGAIGGDDAVVFGSASGVGKEVDGEQVVDLSRLSPADGFVIQGETGDNAGINVSAAGDVNGDGFDDVIVGANHSGGGGREAGAGFVIFGSETGFGVVDESGRQVVDLTSLSPAEGFAIQGDSAGDFAGFGISSAGDINGDGLDDLIVGAPKGDDGGNNAGEAYVIFGSQSGFGAISNGSRVVDLTTLSAADGFVIQGDAAGDQAGWSVSSAGDVNGDGFDDLVVGALLGDDAGRNTGEAYVIYGTAHGFGTPDDAGRQVVDLTTLLSDKGFVVPGDVERELAGINVSAAGDVNLDGYDDVIVGADGGGKLAGEAYVVFGGPSAPVTPVHASGTFRQDGLAGGSGDDILNGRGGADAINAGAGDDRITVGDTAFLDVDGGSGSDVLTFRGIGIVDFTELPDNRVSGIEALDLSGNGRNTLVLGANDVFRFSDTPNADFVAADSHQNLVVDGNRWDTLELVDPDGAESGYLWVRDASDIGLDGSRFGDYDVYNLMSDGVVLASLAVDADIAVRLI